MLELVWSILLYKSFEKVFIWGWIWFEACCFTNPLRISRIGRRSQMLIFSRKWSIWRHLGRPGLEMPKFSKTVGCQKPYKIRCKMLRQTRFQASGRPGTLFEVSGSEFPETPTDESETCVSLRKNMLLIKTYWFYAVKLMFLVKNICSP